MKNARTRLVALTTALALSAFGTVAFAKPHRGGGHGGMMGHRLMKIMKSLDLSESQEDLLFEMRLDAKKSRKALRPQRMQAMKAVGEELAKDTPDAAALHALVDQQFELMKQQAHARVEQALTLHRSLTPEQKAKLAKRLEKMQRRARKMHDLD